MKKTILLALPVAIVFGLIGVYFSMQKYAPAANEHTAMRQFLTQSMPDADGKEQPMSQWTGKNLVLNFWATWCAPCVDEMPELSALQKELSAQSIQIIGIGIDSPSNIAEFSKKYNIAYPLYVAGMTGTELSRRFGNQAGGLPFTVIIGSDGSVKKTYIGRLNIGQLRKDLVNLL